MPTALPSTNDNERCPDGFNVSPSEDCEAVSSGGTNFMNNATQNVQVLETNGSNDSQNNNVLLLVEATQGMTGPPAWDGWIQVSDLLVIIKGIKREELNSLVLMEILTRCHLEIMTVRDLLA